MSNLDGVTANMAKDFFEEVFPVPFDIFHEAIEKTLGRPVFTHEFGLNREGLKKELFGEKESPTLEDVINLIPEEKLILIYN